MKYLPLAVVVLAGAVAACAPEALPTGRPTPVPSALTLNAQRAEGTVYLTAQLRAASGENLPGHEVIFSASAGSLTQNAIMTDAAGMATTQLTTNAAATVSASAGPIMNSVTVPAFVPVAPILPSPPPPPNLPPTVARLDIFSASKNEGTHQSWTFDMVTPIADVEFYRWSFGDGETASTDGPFGVRHIYRTEGSLVVTVEAIHRGDRRVIGRGELPIEITFQNTPPPPED